MANSDSLIKTQKSLRPALTVFLSIVLFLLIDNLVFRTAFYAELVPPVTTSMRLARFLKAERARRSSKEDILLMGNSKMQFAFWDRLGEEQDPTHQTRMIQAAVGGSSEKWSYYMLKYLDP